MCRNYTHKFIMAYNIIQFVLQITFSSDYDYDQQVVDSNLPTRYTHRENIVEALNELASRSIESAQYLVTHFGATIKVSKPLNYSLSNSDFHFNISANGKKYHVFVSENNRRIRSINEITTTTFHLD